MAGKRGGAKSTSWRDDDAVGDGENTADGDELDELVEHQKHPSFRGHPGSMQSTPRDDTRRNMRALRKSKDPEVGVSEEPVSQVDPVVMRKIQGDLDKLARRNRERERSKRRGKAREDKDIDRAASRMTGAGVGEKIIHTPLAGALDAMGAPPFSRSDTNGSLHHGSSLGGSSKRGSFVGVAYGNSSEDDNEDDRVSIGSHEKGARGSSGGIAVSPRAPTPPPFGASSASVGETPDSLRYMEVMSRYLSTRGVYGSLLDELEEEGVEVWAGLGANDATTAADPETPPVSLPTQRTVAARPRGSHGRALSGSNQPVTPNTLSPAARPFAFDVERYKNTETKSSSPRVGLQNTTDSSEPGGALRTTLAASITHMKSAVALSPADRAFAAAAVEAENKTLSDDEETSHDPGGEDSRDARRVRFTELRDSLRSETPKPGSEEAETDEGTARIAARRAGVALRNALDAAVAAAVDGETKLGDAQHASADVLYELERASAACARAVDRAASSKTPEAAALAVVTHARLSGVVLEEVSSVATHASWALRELSRSLRATSHAEAAAGEAAEEAAAAAMVENTDNAVAAAARADREADAASADAANALVRAAHAGAYVAQHLGVYSRWAKRASSWAGHPPPAPSAQSGGVATGTRLADPDAASHAADAVYARATHDVVVSWAGYIGASAAAAPPEDARDREIIEDETGGESADDEETAFWGGVVPAKDTGVPYSERTQKKESRRPPANAATRRAFLRSLWVQAYIAQSCVQSAFSTSRVARFAKTNRDLPTDFDELVGAAMRVIAVATTVEKQLALLGDDADEPAFGNFSTTEVTPAPEAEAGVPKLDETPGNASASKKDASVDYIDALWTSVSQVRSLRFEKAIKIGRGGFSTVLRATWRGSTVAVKVLDPTKINGDVVDAIKREVTVMTANRHPHIVCVLAASVQLPDASIIMEHCAFGSLSDVLAKARKDPEKLCWRVRILMASDAACGLAFLHSSANQIAHRDFNTSNLLVTEDMRVKIADFGLSRLVRLAGKRETIERSQRYDERDDEQTLGTSGLRNCLFHAPEVISSASGQASVGHGKSETDHTKSDVFSFGAVLWCLGTLAPAWEQTQTLYENAPPIARFYQTMKCVSEKVLAGERLAVCDVRAHCELTQFTQSDELTNLITKCFETDPSRRPTMTSALRVLKKMRKLETQNEFKRFPVPIKWAGFLPAAVPHMSAVGATSGGRVERSDVSSFRSTPTPFTAGATKETEPTPSQQLERLRVTALLVVGVAVASFAAGRYWR